MVGSNEYDNLLTPDPSAGSNEYGPIVGGGIEQQKSDLQQSMFVASKTNPDRAAEVQKLATRTNLPPEVVDRNFEEVSQRQVVAANDYDTLVDKLPKTADWMSNPNNASVAHDDVHNLGGMEEQVTEYGDLSKMYHSLAHGLNFMYSKTAQVPALLYDTAALPQNLAARYLDMPDLRAQSPEWLRNNPVSQYFDAQAQAHAAVVPELSADILGEIGKGNYSKAARAAAMNFVASAPEQAAIIASTLAGYGVPALVGAGVLQASDVNARSQATEVAPENATANALLQGTVESAFETIGTFGVLRKWESAIAKKYGKEVSKEVFMDFAKTIGYSVAAEGNEEALTSAAQDFSDYITGVNPDALKGIAGRAVNAGIVGGLSGGLLTGPSALGAGLARGQAMRHATLTRDFYTALGTSAEATALRERMPEAQKAFVEHLTKGTGVENIFIAPEVLDAYFQGAKQKPAKAMQDIGALDAYTQAKASGSDVQIPLATWIDKVVGTEHYAALANDIKFSPGEMSVNEAKAHQDETKAQLAQEAQQAEADVSTQAKIDESAAAVGNTIAQQLQEAGQDPQSAIIHEQAFKSLGQRLGIDPQKLFDQYRLEVQGNTEQLTQGVDSTGQPVTMNQESIEEEVKRLRARNLELETEARTSPLTGLRNQKAFLEDEGLAWKGVSAIDMDGLKRLNDAIGHEGADTVLKALGAALIKAQGEGDKVRFYHRSGDEFAGRFQSAEDAHRFMADLQSRLEKTNIAIEENGNHTHDYKGVGISFGIGTNYEEADKRANEQKRQRLEAGTREDARKSGAPARLVPVATAQTGNQNNRPSNGPPRLNAVYEQGPRGQIQFLDKSAVIKLSKSADPSTFFHESGHYFLEILGKAAESKDAPKQVKDDYKTLLEWLNVDSKEKIGTEQHEQFARGFEAYLMEGKAPSSALKQAFTRFKVWLTSVYQSLKSLNVNLTPEVRGVMDRLLATDEEIAAAQRQQNYRPLFADPSKFGLTGDKAARYERAVFEAKEAAQEQLSAKVMADYDRQRQTAWKQELAKTKERISADVNKQPVYVAESVMRRGVMPDGSPLPDGVFHVKLSFAALERSFKGTLISKLPRGITTRDGGLHPDIAAEMFGFNSGAEMVVQLAAAEPKEALIDRLAHEQMKLEQPDFIAASEFPAEAMKAIHNDKQAYLMRLELEHLASNNVPVLKDVIRQVARRIPTNAQVKEQAQMTIGTKAVGEIKPYLYERAEAKMAKLSGEALAKGDFQAAFEAKQKQLLNHELYRAAVEAQQDVEDSLDKFKRIFRTSDEKVSKSRDMDLVNAARAVLAQFGLGKANTDPDSFLENIKRYDPDTYDTVKSLVDSATQNVGNYKSVAYNDFADMRDTVNALWDLAKSTREIEIDGKKIDREQVMAELGEGISTRLKPGEKVGYNRAATKWDRTKMGILGIRAALRRVESWVDSVDGGNFQGPFRTYLFTPIADATGKYRVAKNEFLKKYLDLLAPIEKALTTDEILAPELGYRFSGKAELLGAILHTGNQSNLQKLLRGRNWGTLDQNNTLDTSRWDTFLARMYKEGTLTKADYEFAQSIWNLMEELKPGAQQAHKKMYGFYFNEITAHEVVTPFGTYKGGYVPAKADPFIAQDAAIRNEKEALERSNNSFAFPTSGRGATKTRVEAYAAPLQLSLQFVPQHIDWALRFTHIEPHVKSAARIVMNREFRKQLDALDPTIGGDMLVPWLQRAAQQKIESQSNGWGGRAADTIFREIRRRTGLNIMVANVSNTLQQFTGLSIAAVKVEPKHLRNALWEYVRSPKITTDAVNESSDFMKTRVTGQVFEIQQNIDDMLLNPSKYEQARRFAQKHGYVMQAATQNIVDVITWHGAHNQAIENGAEGLAAIREADAAVRQTQGSFNPEDVSRFETGTPFMRAFTMFYSYFNMQANLLGTEFANIARDMGLRKGAGRALYVYTLGFMIPAVLSEAIVKAMSGKLDDNDDDQYVDDLLNMFLGGQFRTATAMFPIVGPTVQAGINQFNNKWYDDRISTSPAVSAIESAVSAPHSVYKAITEDGSKKRAARDALTALGLLTGLPVAPLSRPAGYLLDYADGNAEPTGPIDFARGLISGKSGR